MTRTLLDQAGSILWTRRLFVENSNTAQYPPVLYIPQAMAIKFGQIMHFSIVLTLRLARMSTALAASAICAVAFAYARRTVYFLVIVSMLPMNLFLFASASQDGLMLACTMLAIGVLDRIINEVRDASRREKAIVTALLAVVVMARPPYVPFALLGLLLTRRIGWPALLSTAGVIICAIAWVAAAATLVTVPMNGADPVGQLRFLFTHPSMTLQLCENTWITSSRAIIWEMIGRLGWLDTGLSPWFYNFAALALGIGLVTTVGGSSRKPLLALVGVLSAGFAVALSEYLTWTKVGSPIVSGLQGRYFEELAAVGAICLPGFPILSRYRHPLGLIVTIAMAIVSPLVLLKAIVWRYYFS